MCNIHREPSIDAFREEEFLEINQSEKNRHLVRTILGRSSIKIAHLVPILIR
jgi:hypothetical protein